MKLISMTDYVLEQKETSTFETDQGDWYCIELEKLDKIRNYANFLKQPLELWMFVPCDENDKIMIEPNDYMADKGYFKKYQQAKERCLFKGFEWSVAQFCDEPMIELEDKNGNYLLFDNEDKNFQSEFDSIESTIEDLVKYNLPIT